MNCDEKLINLTQVKLILIYIQKKLEKAINTYAGSSGYKRIALAKKVKKLKEDEASAKQAYNDLKEKYEYN